MNRTRPFGPPPRKYPDWDELEPGECVTIQDVPRRQVIANALSRYRREAADAWRRPADLRLDYNEATRTATVTRARK